MKAQPKLRSKFYMLLASVFVTARKHVSWQFSGNTFAITLRTDDVGNSIFRHQSLLLRPLRNVDMWMQHNKVTNLAIAIRHLDGLILRPGETFSYWKLIGKPTKSKGYLLGMVLDRGGFKAGIGGGVCQLSNLIYWMTLHTPLTVTERWRHSYDVFPDAQRTLPFGSGATCSYPNIDLQIRNDTSHVFQLKLRLSETHLVGEWLSNAPLDVRYEIEERKSIIQHEAWGGYTRNNELVRLEYDIQTGEKIKEEYITENHAIMMYSPLLK